MEKNPTKVRFFYIKSNHFRVIDMQGAHGGITPRGNIFAALFNERSAIPQATVQRLNSDGLLGPEIVEERTGKEGIVREVEVGIMMDLSAAVSFHQWLGDKIDKLKNIGATDTEGKT